MEKIIKNPKFISLDYNHLRCVLGGQIEQTKSGSEQNGPKYRSQNSDGTWCEYTPMRKWSSDTKEGDKICYSDLVDYIDEVCS